jgi:hypothetical protein
LPFVKDLNIFKQVKLCLLPCSKTDRVKSIKSDPFDFLFKQTITCWHKKPHPMSNH